jgi:hypothetical protein
LLHGRRDAAIRVAFAQHGIHGAAEHAGIPRLDVLLGVVARVLGVIRNVVALFLELLDRALQLRHRGADVRQLDDVGFGRLGDLAELLQVVADCFAHAEPLGELREDSSGERDVARLDDATGRFREGLHDRQQRIGSESRRFVREGIDDLGHEALYVIDAR